MENCKLCSEPTDVVFNIELNATPICENCASSIFIQQANWYVKQPSVLLGATGSPNYIPTTKCPACQEEHENWFIPPNKFKCTTCSYVYTVEKEIYPTAKRIDVDFYNNMFCKTCNK